MANTRTLAWVLDWKVLTLESLWGGFKYQILSTLKTHKSYYLYIMQCIYIIFLKSINKFTWALDRDILCIMTKITLLTAFLQYFANIIVLRPSKNMKIFVESFYTCASQYKLFNTHIIKYWLLSHSKVHSGIRFFPHWGPINPSNQTSWNTFILHCWSLIINLHELWIEIFSAWWPKSPFWPIFLTVFCKYHQTEGL